MNPHVRRVVIEPQKGRRDVSYVIFDEGKFSTPLMLLDAITFEKFVDECRDQLGELEDYE